jgi:HlyD family secretion protein
VAPFAGRVSAVSVQAGEQVPAGGTVVTLIDAQAMQVDVSVDETDVPSLKVGQNAQITFDAMPGQTFSGQVLAITPQATVTQGVATYPVAVSIDPRGQVLPAGLSASVRVITAQRPNVLVVPNRAVQAQGGARVVTVLLPDGTTQARRVQVGLVDDQQTEIVAGLNAGDRVVLPGARTTGTSTSAAGQTARPAGPGFGVGIPGAGFGGGPGRGR